MLDQLKDKFGNLSAEMGQNLENQPILIGGEIKISGNGTGLIQHIEIDDQLLTLERKEELQDKLVIALHDFYTKAKEIQATESSKALSSMIPPHLAGMFGLK